MIWELGRGAGIEAAGDALAQYGQVHIAGIEHHHFRDRALQLPPFGGDVGGCDFFIELALCLFRRFAHEAVMGLDQFGAEIGFGILVDGRDRHHVNRHKMSVVSLGQADGKIETCDRRRRGIYVNENISKCHGPYLLRLIFPGASSGSTD